MAQSAVSLGAADTQANEFDPEPRFESAEVMLADVDMPVGNDYYSDTEDFYADIDDIAAFRDETPGFSTTQDQILQLWSPSDPSNRALISDQLNNSPSMGEFIGGFPTGGDISVNRPSYSVPGASEIEMMGAEMRALSQKEDAGTISDAELQLLRAYQEYMGGRTGYSDGGMVSPMDAMGPPTGPDPQLMGDSYEEMPEMGADEADPMAGMDDFMGGVLQIDVFEEVDPVTARSEAFDETLLAPLGAQIELGPRVKAQLDEILGRTGRETYG